MRKKYYMLGIIAILMLWLGSMAICSANDTSPPSPSTNDMLLIVIDNSKEPYGSELQNEVTARLKKRFMNIACEASELSGNTSKDSGEWFKAEQPALAELAQKTGAAQVLLVEILPTKSDFSDLFLYKSIQSVATLKIRLYDAGKQQYIMHEEIAGTGTNKTFIPYTSVGKKVTVLEAVRQAADIAARKVLQNR